MNVSIGSFPSVPMGIKESPEEHPYADTTELLTGPLEAPGSVSEVGVSRAILEGLALKILYIAGSLSLKELAARVHLRHSVADELFRRLRAERLCEVTGMTGDIPEIAITSVGRSRAVELLSVNQYVGAAPVSLESYVQQVRKQGVQRVDIHPLEVERAFSHLVLDAMTLRKLGTALNSGNSIFLYGPSGAGKTAIASSLSRVLARDGIWIPFAVEVAGEIISIYDPLVHSKIDDPISQSSDMRWVFCHRPTVLVGGELTIEMLELQLNPVTRFYVAPLQMKANSGVLIIDDFGRQRIRPEELLNRWVVPLDRKIDFLTLAGGKKVEIPFELLVVFATNLDPSTLVDAAFLRRMQTKIKVGAVSEQQFHEIFRGVCRDFKLAYEACAVDELIKMIQGTLKEPLRACQPRDIVNQVRWAARYEQREPLLDRDSLLAAVDAHFVPEETEDIDNQIG